MRSCALSLGYCCVFRSFQWELVTIAVTAVCLIDCLSTFLILASQVRTTSHIVHSSLDDECQTIERYRLLKLWLRFFLVMEMDIVSMALPKYGPYIGYSFFKKPNFMCEHLASFRKGYWLYIYQVSLRSMLRNRIIIWFEKPGFSFFRTSKCTLWAKNGSAWPIPHLRKKEYLDLHLLIFLFGLSGLLLKLFLTRPIQSHMR